MAMINTAALLGKNDCYIDYLTAEAPLHRDVVNPFLSLQKRAKAAGFDLAIASSYRNFDRQLAIWNAKLKGERPVFDDNNTLISLASLSPWQQLEAVLRWSALPGASRHHWGTDIDIYDRAAVDSDYQIQLSPIEASNEGPFGELHNWLDQELSQNPECGFFRPYQHDSKGIAPERWHLSYAPVAAGYQRRLTLSVLKSCYQTSSVLLAETITAYIQQIFERFVWVDKEKYPLMFRHLL